MSKWKWFAIVGLVVCVVVAVVCGWTKQTISVSESMAEMVVEKELPKMHAHGVQVNHLQIRFHDAAEITLEVEGSRLGKQFSMVVTAVGQPDITHSHNGEFYFRPEKVDIKDFKFSGIAPSGIVQHAAERYLLNHPGMQNALDDAAPHIEGWMKTAAEMSATTVLQHVPVYKLKDDWKGLLLGASVSQAKVVGDHLDITFSVLAVAGLFLKMIGIAAICVIVFIGFMVAEI